MKVKIKLCAIFNYAPHYRLPIYKAMDNEFDCEFYFGDEVDTSIKKINYRSLKGFRGELKNCYGKYFLLRKGVWKLAFRKNVKYYLISWEPLNISLWFFLIISKILGKKVYSWQHGISRKKVTRKFILLEKFFLFLKEGTFLYGHYARQNMIQMGFNPNKLFVIYNSLDYERSLELRKKSVKDGFYRSYFENNAPVLLFIGRLTAVKKLDMIVEAHKMLMDQKVFCNVVFVGDGEMKETLIQKIKAYDLEDRYYFTGAIYDEEKIAEFLANADLCISPGNVGLTAIHSLSYGLPVITNDNFETQMPEFESIKTNETGQFFEENNTDDLKLKISDWISSKRESRQKRRMKCYEVIDNLYNPLNQIKILRKIIR